MKNIKNITLNVDTTRNILKPNDVLFSSLLLPFDVILLDLIFLIHEYILLRIMKQYI